ncbi:MAG: gamma-glutamyltransferase, partial [Phycisphaeraceae bacterium]|nr:gamma-glutamyltransferase [Phycisphaeraceae bacterium]
MLRAHRVMSALGALASVVVVAAASAFAPPQAEAPPGKGVVAADHVVASVAGVEMLRKGGNAVDAAVASSFTLSVVRPFSCGIGGGGFMVLRVKGRDGALVETAINYREWGPGAATPDMFERGDESASTIGGKAVAVPGTVAGLLTALERYGTLDRATVMRPAIVAAREGFRVDAAYLKAAASTIEKFRKHPAYQKKYAFVWDRLLARGQVKEGDLIQLPEQAEALELIARDGAAAFYEGPIAEAIEKAVKADRGILNRADLRAYARQGVVESAPLAWTFAGRRVLGMPLPSSGGVAMAQAMGILERTTALDAAKQGRWAEWMQLTVESVRHAMADRSAYLWDGGTGADAAPVGCMPKSRRVGSGSGNPRAAAALASTVQPVTVIAFGPAAALEQMSTSLVTGVRPTCTMPGRSSRAGCANRTPSACRQRATRGAGAEVDGARPHFAACWGARGADRVPALEWATPGGRNAGVTRRHLGLPRSGPGPLAAGKG